MSIVAFKESVAAGATEVIYVELGRPFMNALTLSAFSSAVMTDLVGVRIACNGESVFPKQNKGASSSVWLENHTPMMFVTNLKIPGPPYELEITFQNLDAANAVTVSGILETYSEAAPRVRLGLSEQGQPKPALGNLYLPLFPHREDEDGKS